MLTQNQQALEGLNYGADDFDLPIEDEVTQKAGATISLDFERILNYARELGFEPEYRHVALGRPALPVLRIADYLLLRNISRDGALER